MLRMVSESKMKQLSRVNHEEELVVRGGPKKARGLMWRAEAAGSMFQYTSELRPSRSSAKRKALRCSSISQNRVEAVATPAPKSGNNAVTLCVTALISEIQQYSKLFISKAVMCTFLHLMTSMKRYGMCARICV